MKQALFDLIMSHNSIIIEQLHDCEKPDSLGVSASVFSIQLATLIFNLDISEENVHDLIEQYIEQFSKILSPEEKAGVRQYIGADMHIYSKVLSKEEPARWMHVATNCIFEFTETPYDPTDAVMVTTCILYFVTEATPYFPKSTSTEDWSNKSIKKQPSAPVRQTSTESPPATSVYKKKKKDHDKVVFAVIIAAVLLLVGLLVWFDRNPNSAVSASAPVAPTATLFDRIVQPISNGQKICRPAFESDCPLSVSVPDDGNAYYVYFKYVGEPQESVTSRESLIDGVSKGNNLSFYIAPGKTVETEIPVGNYRLYYAVGKDWYGAEDLFGPSTEYCSSDTLLSFYTEYDGDYIVYNGQTLELWLQTDGNMSTHAIDPTDFP